MAIIYKITNKVNGKCYIGATEKTLEERWNGHVKTAMVKKKDWILSKAIRKYGPDAFIKEVLEEHPDRKYTFDVLEPKYILEHNTFGENGYNMTGGSEGGIGHKHTEETRKRISLGLLGKPLSEKHRESIRLGNLGKKMSEEAKEKMRLSRLGKNCSEETKQKLRLAMSEETKQKLRLANLGKKRPQEVVDRIQRTKALKRQLKQVVLPGDDPGTSVV